MHASLILGALMAMGAAAVPVEERSVKTVVVDDCVTVTVTGSGSGPTAAAPAPVAAAPANNGGSYLEGSQPAAQPSAAPSADTSNYPTISSSNSSDPYTAVVNKYRKLYGLSELAHNPNMESNIQNVGAGSGGTREHHILIPGQNMGQCITPGQWTPVPAEQPYSPFEMAYLAWLCEVDTDPQLAGKCQPMQSVLHMEYSDTGHHAIIVDPKWNSFCCGWYANPDSSSSSVYQGIYTCDYSTETV